MRSRLLTLLPLLAMLAGCGGASAVTPGAATARSGSQSAASAATTSGSRSAPQATATVARRPDHRLVDRYPGVLTSRWQVMTRIGGRPALWIERRAGVTLVRIDQTLAHLALHAGATDPGGSGWVYGSRIAGRELRRVILGVNGGFKFVTGAGGFVSFGRTGRPLVPGRGSIVTYRDGITDIGSWGQGVPAPGQRVASVRQNLGLMIDQGRAVPSVASCGEGCWGATIGGASAVARSGLGIQRNGRLIWAAGEGLTVGQLAAAMTGAGVVRAVELDINPDWVAGYLYVHRRHTGLEPIPVVPGQLGIYGHLLTPYARDFFTVLSNY
ncbi:MAG TPA: phosphodiester glycosidase family protein [Solirubrobacteraceae bacterium]|nr:phosphodiester glycosidase family protein [Solirubrobacteraceae bacterium]